MRSQQPLLGCNTGRSHRHPQDLEIAGRIFQNVTRVDITAESMAFRITFNTYVGYSVLNESYSAASQPHETYTGKLFRVYTKSNYLNHLASETCASDEYPGLLHHYCLVCADHIVNIVTDKPPEVAEIDA